jgi:hypothetical protein
LQECALPEELRAQRLMAQSKLAQPGLQTFVAHWEQLLAEARW